MTPVVPRIGIFSTVYINDIIKTSDNLRWMADSFEIHYFNNDSIIDNGNFRISAAIIVGNKSQFKKLCLSNIPILNVDSKDFTGDLVYDFFIEKTLEDSQPTISIFTPAHNTFDKFLRCYNSVVSQSFSNWEWIILDDSADDKNFNFIKNIIKNNKKIKLYKANRPDTYVGSTKKQAAGLCNGKYIVELDHDDELHHLALEFINSAFNKYPDADFCYSDSCEVFENGNNVNYGNNFGLGYGLHYPFIYKGRKLLGANVPVNSTTTRHIVGAPNHFRCWRKSFYEKINKHNNKLYVVDDYELIIRTFLNGKIIHIPEVLYIQYMNSGGNNTQEPRRAEIQRLVDRIQKSYNEKISKRCVELEGRDRFSDPNYVTRKYGERELLGYRYEF